VSDPLQNIYARRFDGQIEYRRAVWRVLIDDYFQQFVPANGTVLDLACGYGEFINQVRAGAKFAMDLNPDTPARLAPGIRLLPQDCSAPWDLDGNSLDVVFTSNFFEHLPDKTTLLATLREAWRCLKPGGRMIALGPNIKYLPGAYWDFWDHHLPLTEASLAEGMQLAGFQLQRVLGRFLPFSMSQGPRYPLACLRWYLRLPWVWRFFGKQFLLIAQK